MRKYVCGGYVDSEGPDQTCLGAVWSGPSLSDYGTVGYGRLYRCRTKTLINSLADLAYSPKKIDDDLMFYVLFNII